MALNKGKAFEAKFSQDFKKSFPNGTIDRIYDTVNGYRTITNVSDFIGYSYPCIMYCECKSHQGSTWNFSYFTQFEKLKTKIGIKGVIAGVILWMIDHDVVVFLPVEEVEKMKNDGHKSFNIKMLDEKVYNILVFDSVKKRVFLDTDYSKLLELAPKE
ncbi:MAG: hypothetical protein J6W64_01415 [Bacilli bacterium]|nr:hypothetical protein [Bacilli bacterium]